MTDTKRTILVTGATGNIGRHVVAGLLERGVAVRAMSRRPGSTDAVAGDFTDAGSLAAAASDVDAVFLLWPFFTADNVEEALAALTKHARRVVYVSAMSAENGGVWGQVEQAVRNTGAGWTFLRAGGFATNTLEWAPAIRAGDDVRIPYVDAARSLIHERDIADIAVRALTEDGHNGAAYVLTGPAAITQAEQVRLIGEAIGRPARAVEISAAEARARMAAAYGDPAFVDAAVAYWGSLVATPEPVTRTVEEVTGRPARSFAQWARDHAADFQPMRP